MLSTNQETVNMNSIALEDEEKRRVPKSAAIILVSEIFDRYSMAAISTIVLLFLNLKLGYDRDISTALYHAYECLAYLLAIVGGTMADGWLGMYKTIVLMSIIFAIGAFLIAIAVVDSLHLPMKVLSIVGLVILCIGGGCLKPLCATYGGLQYKSTEVKSIALYFSLYYFMFNSGSITARIISPILRQDTKCFGNEDCFPLAFAIPGVFMLLVGLLSIIANRYSETTQTTGSNVLNVIACVGYAVKMKFKSSQATNLPIKQHWLDYGEDKYGKTLIRETRLLVNVLSLYLPIPLFWALFFQQSSRWVFQAVKMNGDLGFYTLKPDQLLFINPLMVLILIPLFDYVIYPQLSKIGIKTALHKILLGGILSGVAFIISAVLETQINVQYLHMGWMMPQYLCISVSEVLVNLSLIHFSYSEAPSSMKSILQSVRLLAVGLGNMIVAIVAGSKLIDSQMYEFILFAGLMFVDMIIFAMLAKRFNSLKQIDEDEIDSNASDPILERVTFDICKIEDSMHKK